MQTSRRDFVGQGGGAVLGGVALINTPFLAHAFPSRAGEEVLPWVDQPPENPEPGAVRNLLQWQELDSWITPNDEFFAIGHYNWPAIDAQSWTLEIGGRTAQPLTFTLEELRARPRREVVFTLECSGNHGFPWFIGGIGTAKWAGTPLAAILEEARVLDDGREVIFFGADEGEEEVREIKTVQNFGRSMSLADAMSPDNLLCYEMNGAPLPEPNGFPLRLIAPGWFGIANVKWLTRIEVGSSRYMGRFMAQDYVTLREERQDGETVWRQTSVGRALLKSVPAKVTRSDGSYRIIGAAWGAPIARVEVRIDDGPWQTATIDQSEQAAFAWKLWSLDWSDAAPGEHGITSRAVDTAGNVQPAPDDPVIAGKHTYWESNGQVTRRVGI
jgi:DMSO/TMAO reductase YedYZ molybdopterin-dependent catalytic subunit